MVTSLVLSSTWVILLNGETAEENKLFLEFFLLSNETNAQWLAILSPSF
jgi:hypothetical protein